LYRRQGRTAINNAAAALANWAHAPFRGTPLSPLTYFMLVGLVMVAMVAWSRVLTIAESNLE
jgi:hypothetical protein